MAGIDLRNKLEDGGIVYGTMLSLSRNPPVGKSYWPTQLRLCDY